MIRRRMRDTRSRRLELEVEEPGRCLEAERDFDVVDEADGGALALQLARWPRPSVMFLDPQIRRLPSSNLARALITETPENRVVLLTGTST